MYHPKNDPIFAKPFIDIEEWREAPVKHLYVHGGFENTELRFAFFFPQKEQYDGRFFQVLTPVQGNENASLGLAGEDDNIGFAITHGAYFVESNMGGMGPDPTMLYRASAASAEYSREVAKRLYDCERPYGYVFGGSGGAFKTMSCVESTKDIWDGSVPCVMGTPMSIPNMFTVRAHAMRLLRNKWERIIDAVEPGGSGDMYADLTDEEAAALREATRLGFPPRAWFSHKIIGTGALPVLKYAVDTMDASYYTDFWEKPGYLGADPTGSAVRDRLQFNTNVTKVRMPNETYQTDDYGIDSAWQTMARRYKTQPLVELASAPENLDYQVGIKLIVTDGDAKGLELPVGELGGKVAVIGELFNMDDITPMLAKLKPGDSVRLDNSEYIALQTYHRHQVPGSDYPAWDQFRDENGEPLYPQRDKLIGPIVAMGGGGSVQSGRINGKMILVACLMDESAFPWQADWYYNKVKEALGDSADENIRLWFNDNAMHGGDYTKEMNLRMVNYRACVNQALLDVSAWAEKGIAPPSNTVYEIRDAQVYLPGGAAERKGAQPVVTLSANASVISAGEKVEFTGSIEVPEGAGVITSAAFDFYNEAEFAHTTEIIPQTSGGPLTKASVSAEAVYDTPGTYFPVLRVAANRVGDGNDAYTQVKNIARVRVVVSGR